MAKSQDNLGIKQKYPLRKLLNLANLSRSTYYYYRKGRIDKYSVEKQEISNIYSENKGRYGYRRILLALRQKGYLINHKTVLKLMKVLSIQGKQRRNKYRSYKGEVGKIAPNILKREFETDKPYTKLVTDVTELSVCGDKIYLSPIMDLYNREIISYSITYSPNFEQTKDILNRLFEVLPEESNAILHSVQGWQDQMQAFQRILREHSITQSMS